MTGHPTRSTVSTVCLPDVALAIFQENRAQLHALAMVLEGRLGGDCNFGASPPDGAPLTEWRLSQLLLAKLDASDTENAIRLAMGVPVSNDPATVIGAHHG